MFTGLVETLAEVADLRHEGTAARLVVRHSSWAGETPLGASIAVNGCCLTVVAAGDNCLEFEAGAETLACTNLGRLAPGARVNLERSLRLGDRLGGHLVSGHIDAIATLVERTEDGPWATCWFRVPPALMHQIAPKGSVAIDGVSLTVVDVQPDRFSVMLIPHTLANTTLGSLAVGDTVNIETDILAKYVERQLASQTSLPPGVDAGASGR